MFDTIKKLWKITDLRKRILFIAGVLVIFRIAAHIPIPGVNTGALQQLFSQNEVLGLVNVFSGGALENFSIVMMGVGPYITSSIIFQVLQMVIPQLEELSKEGATGQQKINQYTRWATVPLAALQAYGTINLLQTASGNNILSDAMTTWDWVVAIGTVTAGSIFLMWLGELISEKQLGNGVSMIIFAGIIAALPTTLQQIFVTFDSSQIPQLMAFALAGFLTIFGVVFITEGQRNIPIAHARHHQATKQKSYLPLRVNQAGVIPIIFAVTLVTAPPLVAQFLLQMNVGFLNGFMQGVITFFQSQLYNSIFYFILVVAFSYFYTSVVFHPDRIAENLQKGGSFIPGIRPGDDTANYLRMVSNRILLAGALFLGLIAILPNIAQAITSGSLAGVAIGGTSILIVVSVALETVKQIEAQLTLREYDSF
jgi:preprotein translocase subunit SecY